MTDQAQGRWQFPGHGSHRAPPFTNSTPLRIHAHRALRLLTAAGAWAAGLCLVIGSITLVAEAAEPASATHVTAAAGVHQVPAGTLAGHGGQGATVTRTFRGTGNRTTSQFTLAPHRRWDLRWSFTCPGRTPSGHLLIREGDAGKAGDSVSASGMAGGGSTWTYSQAAAHYLVVITNCSWTIQVTGRR
jgi:hypothetical protein